MYRWILGGGILIVLCGLLLATHKSTKTSYVNGLPQYVDIPGREYIFERDCYIFKFKDRDSDWPYVASYESVHDLPREIDSRNIGRDFQNVRILDTVSIGTRFKIVSVRRDQTASTSNITYEILFVDEANRKYPRVDALFMLDHTKEDSGPAPKILVEYAAPQRDR